MYLFDSYAWIEYFLGTEKGKIVEKILERQKTIITIESNIAEIYNWCLINQRNFEDALKIITSRSEICPINLQHWLVAMKLRIEKRKTMKDFGLMDALLLAHQTETNGTIVTGDKHFRNAQKIVFLN